MDERRTGRLPKVAILLGLLATAGCATLAMADRGPDRAEVYLQRGIEALARQDYLDAYEHLAWVYAHNANRPVGARALLALAAMELDPRNPGRRLDVGSEILARYFYGRAVPEWQRPMIETAYLLALELGAKEQEIAAARAEAERVRRLPSLPGPSVRAEMQQLRGERGQLRQENQQLRGRVTQLEGELAQVQAELERIRRTIRP